MMKFVLLLLLFVVLLVSTVAGAQGIRVAGIVFSSQDHCYMDSSPQKVDFYNYCTIVKSQGMEVLGDRNCSNPVYNVTVSTLCQASANSLGSAARKLDSERLSDADCVDCGRLSSTHEETFEQYEQCKRDLRDGSNHLNAIEEDAFCLGYPFVSEEDRGTFIGRFFSGIEGNPDGEIASLQTRCLMLDGSPLYIKINLRNGDSFNLDLLRDWGSDMRFRNGCFQRIEPNDRRFRDTLKRDHGIKFSTPIRTTVQEIDIEEENGADAINQILSGGEVPNQVSYDVRSRYNTTSSCGRTGLCGSSYHREGMIQKTTANGRTISLPPLGPVTTPNLCEVMTQAAEQCWAGAF